MPSADDAPVALTWELHVPLVTHPLMLAYFARVLIVSGVVVGGLLVLLLAAAGKLAGIVPMLELAGAAGLGLAVLSFLVSLILLGKRLSMCFSLDGAGAEAAVRGAHAGRAAFVLGLLTGQPGVLRGAVHGAKASRHVAWSAIAQAHFHKHLHAVTLSNGWRTVMTLFCDTENYEAAATAVRAALAAQPRPAPASPLPGLLLRSFLALLASLPLFNLPFLGSGGMFPATVVLGAALAAIWLLARLAWAVPLGLGWIVLLEAKASGATRESLFGGSYVAFQMLNVGDAITLALGAAGALYLLWLSWALIAGRVRAGLSAV